MNKSRICRNELKSFTAKHVLRYLKGIVDYGLKYEVNQKINLEGYVDSDGEGSAIDRKSTSSCSRKQSCVELIIGEENMFPLAIWDVVCFF